MRVRKAVVTAAGRGVRLFPAADTVQKAMLPVVDRDGLTKPVIQVIAEEALESGIEEICIVCAPGDEAQYIRQFEAIRTNLRQAYAGVAWAQHEMERISDLLHRLSFAPQVAPRGYGHAVYQARDFVGGEPMLLLLGDHLYVSHISGKRCAQQVIELASAESCSVAAVHATREHLVNRYGTVRGAREPGAPGVYHVERIEEKPSISQAEMHLQTPGLRAGHYLCFFGIYVLTPTVFDILDESLEEEEVGLTPAMNKLAQRERHLALEVHGTRHDIGGRLGLFEAQLALGLSGRARDEMVTQIIETLAASSEPGSTR